MLDEHRTVGGPRAAAGHGYLELARAALAEARRSARVRDPRPRTSSARCTCRTRRRRLGRVRLEPRTGYTVEANDRWSRAGAKRRVSGGTPGAAHGSGSRTPRRRSRSWICARRRGSTLARASSGAARGSPRAARAARCARRRRSTCASGRAGACSRRCSSAPARRSPRWRCRPSSPPTSRAGPAAPGAARPRHRLRDEPDRGLRRGSAAAPLGAGLLPLGPRARAACRARDELGAASRGQRERRRVRELRRRARERGRRRAGRGRGLHDQAGRRTRVCTGAAWRRPPRALRASPDARASSSARERACSTTCRQGIPPAEGARVLARCSPRRRRITWSRARSISARSSRQPRHAVGAAQRRRRRSSAGPSSQRAYVAPRDDIERTLVGFWEELLGVDQVGVEDSFFDLGGHSLIAVRLFARIKKAYHVEFPISVLFEAPTIERCADADPRGRRSSRQRGEAAAERSIGEPQAALPAPRRDAPRRGRREARRSSWSPACSATCSTCATSRTCSAPTGRSTACRRAASTATSKPHETFEEMAADYLAEMRQVQPHGPYLLGGFSAAASPPTRWRASCAERGERCRCSSMLDTPIPSRYAPRASRRSSICTCRTCCSEGLELPGELGKTEVRIHCGARR